MAIEFALIPPDNPKILLAPDINKIIEVANGNLGIADNMKKATQITNLSSLDDVNILKKFMDSSKVQLPNDVDSYVKDGKLKIPIGDIGFKPSENFNGLKSLEVTTIKSIFESQKPYMEIIAIMTKSLVDIEDLIARTLALADSSLKPATNPKALGFQYKKFKKDLNVLRNLNNKTKQSKGQKDTNPFDNDYTQTSVKTPEGNESITYEVLGIEYSTGDFEEGVNYDFIYHDIEESSVVIDNEVPENPDNIPRPSIIAFNIQNGSGTLITPPDWLLNSGKWYGQFPQLGGYDFVWKKEDGSTLISGGVPDPEVYGGGWENTEVKIFNQNDINYYKNYYSYLIDFKLDNRPLIPTADKNEIRTTINSKLDINAQLNGVSSGGFVYDFTPLIFTQSNRPILPKQISMSGSNVWIDGESEYDLKFIKIDSTLDIAFFETNGDRLESRIQRFLFNTYNFKFDDNSLFDVRFITSDFGLTAGLSNSNITSNTTQLIDTDVILLDNLTNDFVYNIEVIKKTQPGFFKPIFWRGDNPNDFKLNNPNFDSVQITPPQPPAASTQSGTQSGTQSTPPVAPTTKYEYHYVFKQTNGKWRYNILDIETNNSINSDTLNSVPKGSPVSNGTYSLPNNFGQIIVRDGFIYGWLLNNLDISVQNLQNKAGIVNNNTLAFNETVVPLETGAIRVSSNDDRFGKIINTNQIRNEHLQIPTAYSAQEYGTNQIQQLFRYRTSLDDTQTYYILEGKLQLEEEESLTQGNNPSQQNFTVAKKYYKKPHALGASKKFIDAFMTILTDLIPAIKALLKLIYAPQNFLSEILKQKIGENFELFSPEIISKFQRLATIPPEKRVDFIEQNLDLKKYVYSDKLGNYMYILDGQAIIEFLNIRFGLELKKLNIFLIFDKLKQFGNNQTNTTANGSANNSGNNLSNTQGNTLGTQILSTTQADGSTIVEEVSVVYSTGKKIEGIDYEYIYINETIINLIQQYQEAFDNGDLEGALQLLLEARTLDPKNEFIRKKLEELKNKVSLFLQPILDFLLNLVTMPIKMVLEIIKYIKGVFENINLGTLPDVMKEFITFKWIKEFTSKDFIFKLLGITLDFDKLHDWKKNWKNFPENQMFDLSEIFAVPFFFKLPTVPRNFLQYMLAQICEIINAVLKLLEGIINGVIDLIWALISLDAIIPQPHVKLTRPCSSENTQGLSADELFNLLNGLGDSNSGSNNTGLENFVFDIKTTDGRSLRELNREELNEFVKSNPNFNFKFEF